MVNKVKLFQSSIFLEKTLETLTREAVIEEVMTGLLMSLTEVFIGDRALGRPAE